MIPKIPHPEFLRPRLLQMPVLGFLFLGVVLAGCASGFPDIVRPTEPSGPVVWKHFTTHDDPVKAVTVSGGDIWMGTMKGIIRYRPGKSEYEIFTPDNTEGGLMTRGIYSISVGPDGEKWIGTYGGGLSRFDGKDWRRFSVPDGLGDNWVYDVEFDSSGRMWVATWNGVSVFDGEKFQTYTVEDGLPDKWVYSIALDQDGVFWFGTEGGISRYDGKTWKTYNHGDGVGAKIEDGPAPAVFSPVPSSPDDGSRAEPGYGESAGNHHASGGKQNFTRNPDFIISSVVDPDNRKWFGTWGAGVARFDGEAWTNFTTKEGLGGDYIFALGVDRDGRVWAGTNGGASWFDGKKWRNLGEDEGLNDLNILSLHFDQRGYRWFGTTKGLSVFRGEIPEG